MNDLSEIAPKGHWYTHAPQETHFSSLMRALRESGSISMARVLQAYTQGRTTRTMAE